ncbi:MAG: SDR family oxidoreductase [Streptosporangiales bacterium]|nr:SDR family oxidoreductase [Streptosporangiales bacterium]
MTSPGTDPVVLPVTPSFALTGRRALVTGAGRGIGRAAAAALAAAGAHVVLGGRTATTLDATRDAIAAAGGSAETLVLDIQDTAACRERLDALPACDVLVNSAGSNRPAEFLRVTEDDFDAVVDLNLRAAFFVSQYVAGRLVAESRPGSIIQVSSQMGHVGGARRTVYCATKWALEGLTKAMAIDLAPYGVRVNTIAPTFIETPLTRPFFEDEAFRADVLSRIKLGRLGELEDLMGAVVFLAGDASTLMTGSSMVIDGGWTAD